MAAPILLDIPESFETERLLIRVPQVRCDSRNARSIRVAERVGFNREGELRNRMLAPDGSLRNAIIFALTDDDWKNRYV